MKLDVITGERIIEIGDLLKYEQTTLFLVTKFTEDGIVAYCFKDKHFYALMPAITIEAFHRIYKDQTLKLLSSRK